MVVKIVQLIICLTKIEGHSISFKMVYNFIYLRILSSELNVIASNAPKYNHNA